MNLDINTISIKNNSHLISDNAEIIINVKNKEKFDYDKKMEIVKKISKIKKKEYLIHLFKIITQDNKDYTENNNGIFIFFHNLSDDTYDKIETYINYIYKLHKCNINNSDSQFINSITNDDIINNKYICNKKKIKIINKN
jgi:hypothetical protein